MSNERITPLYGQALANAEWNIEQILKEAHLNNPKAFILDPQKYARRMDPSEISIEAYNLKLLETNLRPQKSKNDIFSDATSSVLRTALLIQQMKQNSNNGTKPTTASKIWGAIFIFISFLPALIVICGLLMYIMDYLF